MGVVDDTIDSTSSGSCVTLGQFISSLVFAILPAFNMNYFVQDFASVILKNGVGTRPVTRRQKTNKWAPRLTRIALVFCGILANCRGDGIFKNNSPSPSFTSYSAKIADFPLLLLHQMILSAAPKKLGLSRHSRTQVHYHHKISPTTAPRFNLTNQVPKTAGMNLPFKTLFGISSMWM
jgi:hypothetical protein